MCRLSLEGYTSYIRMYKEKILFVSGETKHGGERQGREKKKLTFHYRALITAILSFAHVLRIQKMFF